MGDFEAHKFESANGQQKLVSSNDFKKLSENVPIQMAFS